VAVVVVWLTTLPLHTTAPAPKLRKDESPEVPLKTNSRAVLTLLLAVKSKFAPCPNSNCVPVPNELAPLSATLVAMSVPPDTVTFPLNVLSPDKVKLPDPDALVSVPLPLITPLTVNAVVCQNCKDPSLVIAALIGELTTLVIICVSPTLITPPLVTVFVLVVCAETVARQENNTNDAENLPMVRA